MNTRSLRQLPKYKIVETVTQAEITVVKNCRLEEEPWIGVQSSSNKNKTKIAEVTMKDLAEDA